MALRCSEGTNVRFQSARNWGTRRGQGGHHFGQGGFTEDEQTFGRGLAQGRKGMRRVLRVVPQDIEQNGGVNGGHHIANQMQIPVSTGASA